MSFWTLHGPSTIASPRSPPLHPAHRRTPFRLLTDPLPGFSTQSVVRKCSVSTLGLLLSQDTHVHPHVHTYHTDAHYIPNELWTPAYSQGTQQNVFVFSTWLPSETFRKRKRCS